MKAYNIEIREQIIDYIRQGNAMTDAAEQFNVSRSTVYRCVNAHANGDLAPKKARFKRKLDPELLRAEVAKRPDATLAELGETFGVHLVTVWYAMKKLNIRSKRAHLVRGVSYESPTPHGIETGCGVTPSS